MIGKISAICFLAFLATANAQIEGKYSLTSQNNFDNFLNAVDVGGKFQALLDAKPTFTITKVSETTYTIQRQTPDKTFQFTFNDGESVIADPLGADKPQSYTNNIEGGNLVSHGADGTTISRSFSPSAMTLTFSKGGVTATRTFTRV